MKYSCEIIRDLLPLYVDDVASPPSRQMVEEHLAECPDCQAMVGRLKNEETETAIAAEKETVIAAERRVFKRRSAVAGAVVAGILTIPVLVCLIVNLATGSGLGWFFIVLSALLVAASVTVVPLMAPENKGLWTLGSFAATLLLLFGVCCICTGGKWFFTAASAVLFGLSLVFLPFVVKSRVFSRIPSGRKGLAVMAADTVLFLLMMLAIGLRSGSPRFFPTAAAISLPILAAAWGIFAIVCAVRKNRKPASGQEDAPAPRLSAGSGAPAPAEAPHAAPGRMKTWTVVLLALGFPIWLPLLITAGAVVFTLLVVLWSLILSLWAVDLSLIAGCAAGVGFGIWTICRGSVLQGVALICAGAVLAGLGILLFFGCRAATKGAAVLMKKLAGWIRSGLTRKENAQ